MAGLIGALFVALAAWAAGCVVAPRTALPHSVRFTTGAVVLSLCIFALLTLHAGYPGVYGLSFAALGAGAWKLRAVNVPPLPGMRRFVTAVFAVAAVFYLLVAMAPETEPDAIGYHLRLVRDYVHLHRFTGLAEFFDVMPQGAEMLFVPAVAVSGFTSAKVLHFLFLIATIPLIRHIARELQLPEYVGTVAALLFFLSPVAAIDGTSAYIDVVGVCGCASTFYLLVRWNRERTADLLLCAALNAGFCYTVKQTFGAIAAAGLVFVAVRSRRAAAWFALGATAAVGPWMMRAWLVAGSPMAPFLTRWIPNKASTPEIERALTMSYSVLNPQFSWLRALPEYTVLGGHQGLLGAAFVLLPAALLAIRKSAGRWLLAAAFIAALPALANAGTRFLLPSLLFASLALAMALPLRAAIALAVVQVVFAVPAAMDLVQTSGDWRLRSVPWRAALRMERASHYLERKLPELPVGWMIEVSTPPDAHVFSFSAIPDAYVNRQVSVYWHSVKLLELKEALAFAVEALPEPAARYSVAMPQTDRQWLRASSSWRTRLLDSSIERSRDRGQTSWRDQPEGHVFELAVGPSTAAADLLVWPGNAPLSIELELKDGRRLTPSFTKAAVAADLRRDSTAYLRRSGFRYLLISEDGPFGAIGNAMLADPQKWGVHHLAATGADHLFEISD